MSRSRTENADDLFIQFKDALTHKRYGSYDESMLQDCAKIAALMMDKTACFIQLEKLETRLTDKIREQVGDVKKGNILRRMLEDSLAVYGFQPYMGKANKFLDQNDFNRTLIDKLLLKDAGLGGTNHGEFTHAIQWLVIALENDNNKFLTNKIAEIFKFIGNIGMEAGYKLWDDVVDKNYDESKDVQDFRCPEILNTLLMRNFVTLGNVLKERDEKRKKETKHETKQKSETDGRDSNIRKKHMFYKPQDENDTYKKPDHRIDDTSPSCDKK
jgi:hypothetical protein